MKPHSPTFPPAVMGSHTAIVGKTGGGKTITAKDLIEQAHAEGANVCILDPIKSDWWGLTLDADGKRPGLPFHILGGPMGHVDLHADAGDALGRVVATGALRHSIIDMADFGPGDHNEFYNAFAESLFRHKTKSSGTLYLVLEEAHVFCPKERDGVRGENMAVFWTKRLATAARSKGVRIIATTQRTQALHNAVLGSCETVIAHRLTFPADQKPVLDWLKASAPVHVVKSVAESLASLKTGESWMCSGEAQVFERMKFPMIRTFDNSSTPVDGAGHDAVRPPAVDQAALRAIVGEAVKEAEANDPKRLRERIAELEQDLEGYKAGGHPIDTSTEDDLREQLAQATDRLDDLKRHADELERQRNEIVQHFAGLPAMIRQRVDEFAAVLLETVQLPADEIDTSDAIPDTNRPIPETNRPIPETPRPIRETPRAIPVVSSGTPSPKTPAASGGGGGRAVSPSGQGAARGDVDGPLAKLADALLWWVSIGVPTPTREQLAFVAGYAPSGGSFRTYMSRARADGIVDYVDGGRVCTGPRTGRVGQRRAVPPTIADLHRRVMLVLDAPLQKILKVLIDHSGQPVTRTHLAEACGYEPGGGSFRTYLSRLSGLKLTKYPNKTTVAASPLLFPRRTP